MKITIEVESCRGCPHHKTSDYPTSDSFERPEYWWCKNDDAIAPNDDAIAPNDGAEEVRLFIKKDSKLPKLRYISGYVEWNDKILIPEWCPCKLEG